MPLALPDYEGRIIRYTADLIDQGLTRSGRPVNASKWSDYYSFDVMGHLAFGKSFDMLKDGQTHLPIKLLESGLLPLRLLTPIPWMIPVMTNAPILGSQYRRLFDWCADQVEKPRRMKVNVPDIASWLLKDSRGDRLWLNGDSRLIIVAGSDNTAISPTHIFNYLASDPLQADTLRAEIRTLTDPDVPFSVKVIQHAENLDRIINESLRMHPPVPSGVFRKAAPQGITVDGVFIPGDINFTLPHHVIGRCEYHCGVMPNLSEISAYMLRSRGVLGSSQRINSRALILSSGIHQEQNYPCAFFL